MPFPLILLLSNPWKFGTKHFAHCPDLILFYGFSELDRWRRTTHRPASDVSLQSRLIISAKTKLLPSICFCPPGKTAAILGPSLAAEMLQIQFHNSGFRTRPGPPTSCFRALLSEEERTKKTSRKREEKSLRCQVTFCLIYPLIDSSGLESAPR